MDGMAARHFSLQGCALMLLLAQAGYATAAQAMLASPWDAPVTAHAASAAGSCATPVTLTQGIVTADYYSDAAHSVIDPARLHAYEQVVKVWHDAAQTVDDMADRYRATGDASQAACAANWLASFADKGALTGTMSSNQSTYVQGWMLGSFAIAWLKVRDASSVSAAQRERIGRWLADVAALNMQYYDRRDASAKDTDARNNHRYWAGMAVMAAGIGAGRRDLFDWGVQSFRIGAAQITPDGTLPREMARRSRALHYHLFAAAPLVTMAELADANGIDLYGEKDGALGRLVHTAVAGIKDPSFFAERAGIAQEPIKLDAEDLAWAIPFERRFPDPALKSLLDQLPTRSVLYLGGLPPG
jgi:poly(beta-D-mannuronate) lyase